MRIQISSLILMGALSLALSTGCKSKAKNETQPATPAAAPGAVTTEQAKAAVVSGEGVKKVECKSKSETRVLDLRAKAKGCELGYTKSGTEEIVATSASGLAHCEKTSNRIQMKLKGAGYECK